MKKGIIKTISEEIAEGLKQVKEFFKLESWKNDYPEERTVELDSKQKKLIVHWLVERRENIPLDILTSGNYYRLSESGEQTLSLIVKKLNSKKLKLIFTEYELGFIIFWLERTREGLDGDYSNEDFIILLEVYDILMSKIKDSTMKDALEKKIDRLKSY